MISLKCCYCPGAKIEDVNEYLDYVFDLPFHSLKTSYCKNNGATLYHFENDNDALYLLLKYNFLIKI